MSQTRDFAALAPLVLAAADEGVPLAKEKFHVLALPGAGGFPRNNHAHLKDNSSVRQSLQAVFLASSDPDSCQR
jgi:hypothetical protein